MGDIAQEVCSPPDAEVRILAPYSLKKIPCYVVREFRPKSIVFARVGQGANALN
jgi:hypothetical protein